MFSAEECCCSAGKLNAHYVWVCIHLITNCVQNEDFKNIGKITAMSIVQGGSGIPAFHPSVYRYICTGTYLGVRDDTAVPNEQVRTLLREVSHHYDTQEREPPSPIPPPLKMTL